MFGRRHRGGHQRAQRTVMPIGQVRAARLVRQEEHVVAGHLAGHRRAQSAIHAPETALGGPHPGHHLQGAGGAVRTSGRRGAAGNGVGPVQIGRLQTDLYQLGGTQRERRAQRRQAAGRGHAGGAEFFLHVHRTGAGAAAAEQVQRERHQPLARAVRREQHTVFGHVGQQRGPRAGVHEPSHPSGGGHSAGRLAGGRQRARLDHGSGRSAVGQRPVMRRRGHQGLTPHVAHAAPHGHAAAAAAAGRRHGLGGRGQLHAHLDRVQRLAHVDEGHGAGAPADQADQRRRGGHLFRLLVRQELVGNGRRHIRSRYFEGIAARTNTTISARQRSATVTERGRRLLTSDGPLAGRSYETSAIKRTRETTQ